MREIKFRGKSVDDGKWYYGLPYISKDRTKCQIRFDISERGCTFVDVIPETISEFTGLKDKNGVEIYEGDIVKLKYKEWATTEQIIFKDGAFMLKGDIQMFQGISLEVIGNIYENGGRIK